MAKKPLNMLLLDGTDNSGKSTVAEIISKRFGNSITFHDPCYYRDQLETPGISPRTRFYLHMAAREQLLDNGIKPAINSGLFVIQDRLHISTAVYQGHVNGIPLDEIKDIDDRMLKGITIKPVILVTTVETLNKRLITEGEDYWERSGKLEQILQGYLRYGAIYDVPVIWTDNRTPEQIADQIVTNYLVRE